MNNKSVMKFLRRYTALGDAENALKQAAVLEKHLIRPDCKPRDRSEIGYELMKTYRVFGRTEKCNTAYDVAVSNLPPNSLALLSSLKRVMVLLLMDLERFEDALKLLDQVDGLEISLGDASSVVKRQDDEIKTDTWVLYSELYLCLGLKAESEKSLVKAKERLEREKNIPGRLGAGLGARTGQAYLDGLERAVLAGELLLERFKKTPEVKNKALWHLRRVEVENEDMQAHGGVPAMWLESKLRILGSDGGESGAGISKGEEKRWNLLVLGKRLIPAGDGERIFSRPKAAASENDEDLKSLERLPKIDGMDQLASVVNSVKKIAGSLGALEKLAPVLKDHLGAGGAFKRQFGGHLMSMDIGNLLMNIRISRMTGYLRLYWGRDYYESLIHAGLLPPIVRSGEAFLYAKDGWIIDVVFNEGRQNTPEEGRENFKTILDMCYSVKFEKEPEIMSEASDIPEVAARREVIKLNDESLMQLLSELENEKAGINLEDIRVPEVEFDDALFNDDLWTERNVEEEVKRDQPAAEVQGEIPEEADAQGKRGGNLWMSESEAAILDGTNIRQEGKVEEEVEEEVEEDLLSFI